MEIITTQKSKNILYRLLTLPMVSLLFSAYFFGSTLVMAAEPPLLPFNNTGDLFVLDDGCDCILRITPGGDVSVGATEADIAAATGMAGADWDENGIAFDGAGNMYFSENDSDSILKRTRGGTLSVLTSEAAIAAVTGNADADPTGLAFGSDGFLYVLDDTDDSLLRVNPFSGAVTLFVAEAAFEALPGITSVDFDTGSIVGGEAGNIYVASDDDPDAIFKISPNGTPSVLASGSPTPFEDLDVFMTRAPNGDLIIANDEGTGTGDKVLRVTPGGTINTFLSNAQLEAVNGEDLDPEGGIAFDAQGNFYLYDNNSENILRFDPSLNGKIWVAEAVLDAAVPGTADAEGGIAFAPPPPPPPPGDQDGAPDFFERGLGGDDLDYDGNGDGIPDWTQGDVASFPTFPSDGNRYVTIELPPGGDLEFRSVQTLRQYPQGLPSWVSLPFGYFTFRIDGIEPAGNCTTVTMYLNGPAPQTYYKYGPTPDNPAPHWYDFSYDGETGAQAFGNIMVLHLCDGKRGDHDLVANGEILEPGGPAAIAAHAVLFFPYLMNEEGSETELGIINKVSYDLTGTVTFYQEDGTVASETIETPSSPTNPFPEALVIEGVKTLNLPGNGKMTIPPEEIPANAVSAIVSADGNVVGYSRVMSAEGKRYALPGSTRLARIMTIPRVENADGWRSGFGLFNPGDDETTVSVVNEAGFASDVALGSKMQHFFWADITDTPWMIESTEGIAVMEVFENLTSGGDMASILLGYQNLSELFVPTLSLGIDDFTGVGLGNPSGFADGMVTAFGYKMSGAVEEAPLGLLPARGSISANLSDTFGAETLWAKINAVSGSPVSPGDEEIALLIQGLASYGEEAAAKLGAASLNGLKFKDGIVGVVGPSESPTFALLNPGMVTSNITLTAYDSDGAVLMSGAIMVAAGENLTGTVASLVGGVALESGDYVRFVSDIYLYGLEMISADSKMEILPVLQ